MGIGEWVSTSMPYVTPSKQGAPDPWTAEAAAAGRRGTQRIVYAGEVAADPEVAALLGQVEGDTVVVRRRVMYVDDEPCELTDSYYPAHIARGTALGGAAKIPGGAVALLAQLGYAGASVREDVTARMPSEEERQALHAGDREPVLCLTRLTLDRHDHPVQVDTMVMRAQFARLRYELALG